MFISTLGIFLLLLFSSWTQAAEPIKVGLLAAPHDSRSESSNAYLRGAEIAAAEINAKEGKQGIQLLLILRGGNYTQAKTLKELSDLIWEERLHFLMGLVEKEAILPIASLAKEQRVPFLAFPAHFLEAPSSSGAPPNLFWISPAPEAYQRATVRTAAQLPKKRFFLMARDISITRSWAKYFWEELKKLNPDAQAAGEILLPDQAENFEPFIRKVLSVNTEVCVSHLGVKEWVRFAKFAKRQGYFRKITHFEMESGNLEALVSLKKGDTPEGVWGISAFPFWGLDWKETREFVTKYKGKTDKYPSLAALGGYVSTQAIYMAIKKVGTLDLPKLIATLEELNLQTPVGPLAIRKSDHRALWPIWCGVSKIVSDYPFAILDELKAFGPDSF